MTGLPSQPRLFRPNDPVKQGELIEALYRMAGSPTIIGSNGSALYGREAAQQWVMSNGITPIAGAYNLDGAITRQDVVFMLYGLTGALNKHLTPIRAAPNFADGWQISEAARVAVTELYRAGIINGTAQGTFVPLANMSRAECAMLLQLFSQALQ